MGVGEGPGVFVKVGVGEGPGVPVKVGVGVRVLVGIGVCVGVLVGVGVGTLLNYTHSIWGNVLAAIIFRERPMKGFWLLLVAAGIGLYLVINPGASAEQPVELWGALSGLFSGLMGGGAILCIKRLRQTDNPLTIFFSPFHSTW